MAEKMSAAQIENSLEDELVIHAVLVMSHKPYFNKIACCTK